MSKSTRDARVTAFADMREWLSGDGRVVIVTSRRQMDIFRDAPTIDDVYASVDDFGTGYTIR